MKFVIEKLGFEEFKRRWEEAYVSMGHARPTHEPIKLLAYPDDPIPLIMPTSNGSRQTAIQTNGHAQGAQAETPFEMWRRTNVVRQKQDGYVAAVVKLFMGDLTAEQMFLIADLASQGLADPGAEMVEDIIACPGTDTCGLGITSSKGLARALAEVFPAGRVPEDLKDVSVKISGCHNSCAQHHIATIGLHGVGKRIGEHVAPFYELHLGGKVNGTAKIGQMVVKLPAKSVAMAIRHLIDVYRRDRLFGEGLPAFIDRVGKVKLKDELIPYTIVPSFHDDSTFYYDWEGEEEFVLEDLGPGECAGGALEMIENGILEADQELYQAKLLVDKHQYSVSVNKSYRAVLAAAKALLVTEGLEPSTDAETFIEFDGRIAQQGIVPAMYRDLRMRVGDLGPKETTGESACDKMGFAKGFVDACRAATEQMGKDLKLAPAGKAAVATTSKTLEVKSVVFSVTAPTTSGVPVYDLRGVACPLNYVKTKLKLEMMDAGEHLEVWLDAGEPIKNVPLSLKNDGHKLLLQEPLEAAAAHYRILVEKVE